MLSVFDRYVLKNALGACLVTALSLTLIILLTQSIRFLELVIGTDASIGYFSLMMALAVPKFLEAILPIAFAIGVLYTIHRLLLDREIPIVQAAGSSPLRTGRPFLICALFMMLFQFALSGWLSPMAVEKLQQTRGDVKSHYATLMFREGMFNTIGGDLTVFVNQRRGLNELLNLMIHDKGGAIEKGRATTIIAKRGIVNITDETQQLLVYDGTQYQKNLKTGVITRLDFDQYILDIPVQNNTTGTRWREPDERILPALFINTSTAPDIDIRKQDEFLAEANRRFSTPLLYLSYTGIILTFLLLSAWNRREQTRPMVMAGVAVILLHAGYIVIFNETQRHLWLGTALYALALIPAIICYYRLLRARL